MTKWLRHTLILIGLWLAASAVGFGLLVAVFSISGERADSDCRKALMQADFESQPLHMLPNGARLHLLKLDHLSDRVMIASALPKADTLSAAKAAALSMTRGIVIGFEPEKVTRTVDTFYPEVPTPYARYWHGYLVWLRPLLCLGGRDLAYAAMGINFCALLLWLCFAMWRRGLRKQLAVLLVSMLPFTPWLIPQCFLFAISWWLAMAASIVVLTVPWATASRFRSAALMMLTGCAVSYSELLATPLVAFTLPMIMLCLMRSEYRDWRWIVVLFVAWTAGYGMMWMSKWVITAALTDENIFSQVIHSALQRTGDMNELQGTLDGLGRVASRFAPVLVAAALCFAAIVAWAVVRHRRDERVRQGGWVLVVAAIQLAWLAVMFNHTVLHYWFTYRGLGTVVFALGLYLLKLGLPTESKE